MTITAVVTQVFDRYCIESLNPAFAHVWVMVIEATAVTIAMYCLIQFYYQIKEDIAEHSPLLKVLAIKLVIFLSFWQTILISFLTSSGAIGPSKTIQTPDIKVGIPAMLLCIEMALFAIFHFWSFSYRPYKLNLKNALAESNPGASPQRYVGGRLGIKAFIDSMNPWDLIKAIGRSARWLFVGARARHADASYDVAMGRKTTQDSTIPTAAEIASTAYLGAHRPARRDEADDRETLLANPQRAGVARYEVSPQRSDNGYEPREADIGVAATTDYREYRPYHAAHVPSAQEVGIARPYEPPRYEQGDVPYQQPEYRPQRGQRGYQDNVI